MSNYMHLTVLLQCSENVGTGCSSSHGLQQGQDPPSCGAAFTVHEVTHVPGSDWDQTPSQRAVPQIYSFFSSKNGVLQGGNTRILLVSRTRFKIFVSCSFPVSIDLCDAVRIGLFSGDLTGISGSHVGAINTVLLITSPSLFMPGE